MFITVNVLKKVWITIK